MNKAVLEESYKKFGIDVNDLCMAKLKCQSSQINEVVIIAPMYKSEIFDCVGAKISQITDDYYPVYDITINETTVTFINSKMGASNMGEILVPLAFSPCKKIIFLGSVGGLDEKLKIGSIAIPNFSICGDGQCRYFQENNLANSDTYSNKYYPNNELQNELIQTLVDLKIDYFDVNNFCSDTITGQFLHIDEILKLGSSSIEMETASLFYISEILDLKTIAIFNVSDNSISKKSLLGGRTEKEKADKLNTQYFVIPKIVESLVCRCCKK